ncbi:MAG TPA: flagellar protein FlaG [Bryobacteraceae bacterium]|jgi:flagellar protein FlaG|nr:flagellar protein FlaG [Bryobacteraceae bacterium]
MGLTSINPITVLPAGSSGAPATATPVDRTLNRAVSEAVGKLNDAGYAGEGREVTFSIDHSTQQPVIKVIDTVTKEVITQFPPRYVLALADNTSDIRDSG